MAWFKIYDESDQQNHYFNPALIQGIDVDESEDGSGSIEIWFNDGDSRRFDVDAQEMTRVKVLIEMLTK